MNKKILRTLTALCAALVLMGGFSVTAFAAAKASLFWGPTTYVSKVKASDSDRSPGLSGATPW